MESRSSTTDSQQFQSKGQWSALLKVQGEAKEIQGKAQKSDSTAAAPIPWRVRRDLQAEAGIPFQQEILPNTSPKAKAVF